MHIFSRTAKLFRLFGELLTRGGKLMMKYLAREKGSLSLTTMFSTAGGVIFVLLFYNLASYVGTRGALTETARVTARCITPTDPACVSILPDTGYGTELDWYGRTAQTTADVSVRTFRYQASMPSDLWNADFNYYRTNIGDQRFSVDYSLVPVKTFTAKGAHLIPSGVIDASYSVQGSSEFAPLHNPNFPAFEQDRSLSATEWQASQRPFNFISHNSGEVTINAEDDFPFTTPFIQIPQLIAEPGANCSGNCNAGDLAGGRNNSWKNFAYVAIKAISSVRAERNQTDIQWGKRGGYAGLEVEIKDANGQIIPWQPEGTNLSLNWRCLGGADAVENIGTSTRGYNLWLRGPAGSNGGPASSAVCPGGVYQHNAIMVPRGGSYRVRARLANTGNNRARANITLLTYFDDYQNITPPNKIVQCASRNYQGYDQEVASCSLETCIPTNCDKSYCPNQSLKSLSDSGLIKAAPLSCTTNRQNVSFSCTESAKTIPNSAPTLQTANLAVCSDSWRPLLNSGDNANQETICSWEASEVTAWKEVGASDCQAAQVASFSETCENPYTSAGQANTANCKKLDDKIKQIAQSTMDLNNTQSLGAPKFQNDAKPKFQDLENIRSALFWTDKNLQGQALPEEKETISQRTNSLRTFVSKSNISLKPTALDFISTVKSTLSNAYGWEDFEKQATSLIKVNNSAREEYVFSNTYPFNEKYTEEIYYGQKDSTAGWDFQANCSTDLFCECENCQKFDSLESMLRSYAAAEVKEAADPDYQLSVSATHVGYKQIGKYLPGNLPELPECYPTQAVCNQQKSANDTIVHLGRSKTRPEACDSFSECFSRIPESVDLELKQPEEIIDLNLARQVGMEELKKIVPYATISNNCGNTSGCAEINIDTSSQTHALVQVKYNMPLNFPLSAMLQKESIQIIHEKQEVIERDFAGSNFYK